MNEGIGAVTGISTVTREEALKPRLTAEFLATLLEAMKVCGYWVDNGEVANFYKWACSIAEMEPADNYDTPYDYEE